MYAVVETGGKQYRVQEGDVIQVEKLAVNEGEVVSLDVIALGKDGKVFVGEELACKSSFSRKRKKSYRFQI